MIGTALDQMEAAVIAGEFDLAESARLEAYAVLESGPEARLIVFAPEFKPRLENLFWYGQQDEHYGLAHLIEKKASAQEIKATRKALSVELAAAQKALTSSSTPGAATTNAAVIVFREGLEAVLILASLMGSMKVATSRRLRRPMWWGVAWAGVASVATWWVAQQVLGSLARYGEKLEAVVSVVAIAILLLITNWFFHQTYWKDHMTNLHTKKKGVIGTASSQWLGLAALGFTSVYREGFETVLFLQALVLESGMVAVLEGVGLGLAVTLLDWLHSLQIPNASALQENVNFYRNLDRCGAADDGGQHDSHHAGGRLAAVAPDPLAGTTLLDRDVVWVLRFVGRNCTAICRWCLCDWQLLPG